MRNQNKTNGIYVLTFFFRPLKANAEYDRLHTMFSRKLGKYQSDKFSLFGMYTKIINLLRPIRFRTSVQQIPKTRNGVHCYLEVHTPNQFASDLWYIFCFYFYIKCSCFLSAHIKISRFIQ